MPFYQSFRIPHPTIKYLSELACAQIILKTPNSFNKILIEPRLSIKYALNNALNLQTLAEFKSQGINQIIDLEQNFLGIEKRRWIVSDGDALPLTQSKQGSLGLNYDQQKFVRGC